MEIFWAQAILAGVVGAGLVLVAVVAGKIMGLNTDVLRLIGLFFVPEERSPKLIYAVGLVVHFVVGGFFGIIYAILFTAVGAVTVVGAAALWGILFGALHGVVIGSSLGALPALHPRVGNGGSLPAPGFFGKNIGVAMPVALILLHVIYGVTAGIVYSVGILG